jgi:hypothetical protein
MGRFGGTKVKALTVGFVLSLFALVGTTVWGLLQGLLALLAPGSQPLLAAVLGAMAPWLLAAVLLILVSGGLLLWLLIALASRISIPRPSLQSERLSRAAGTVEYYVPAARAVELSDWLAPPEPTTEEKLEQAKEDYAAGNISAATFERTVERLHAEADDRPDEGFPSELDRLLDDEDDRGDDGADAAALDADALVDAMDVTVVEESGDVEDEHATEGA